MKRFTKQQASTRDAHAATLRAAKDGLDLAIAEFNDAVNEAWSKVEKSKDALNSAIEEANEFRQGIWDDMQAFYDEKSEKWQEGDAGSQYQAWMDAWSEELEEADLETPEEMDEVDEVTMGLEAFAGLATASDEA